MVKRLPVYVSLRVRQRKDKDFANFNIPPIFFLRRC